MKKIVTVAVMALIPCPALAQPKQDAFYVSDHGNDQADGTSAATAFKTLERGRNAARASGAGTSVLIAGQFLRSSPLQLAAADKGLTFASVVGTTAELIAAKGTRTGIAISGADGVRVQDLRISGFAEDGIFARNAIHIQLVRNTVTGTRSTTWSQGAIHLQGNVRGALVQGNVVQGADYAGIIVDTDAASDVSDVHISGNIVKDTCRQVADCGAIYVNDRGRRSTGIIIANNVIEGFGPLSAEGRAIYLDDWASGVSVLKNSIKGPGKFALQIHGGHDNRIDGNSINMAAIQIALFVQPATGGQWADLTNNTISNNRFQLASYGQAALLSNKDIPIGARPNLFSNRICINGHCENGKLRLLAPNFRPD